MRKFLTRRSRDGARRNDAATAVFKLHPKRHALIATTVF